MTLMKMQGSSNRWEPVAATEGSTTTTSTWAVVRRSRCMGRRCWWENPVKTHQFMWTGMVSISLKQPTNRSLITSWVVHFLIHLFHWARLVIGFLLTESLWIDFTLLDSFWLHFWSNVFAAKFTNLNEDQISLSLSPSSFSFLSIFLRTKGIKWKFTRGWLNNMADSNNDQI